MYDGKQVLRFHTQYKSSDIYNIGNESKIESISIESLDHISCNFEWFTIKLKKLKFSLLILKIKNELIL